MKKNRLSKISLAEFSLVRRPAHEGATTAITKSADDRVVIAKSATTKTPEIKNMPTDQELLADAKAALAKALAELQEIKTNHATELAKHKTLASMSEVQRLHYKRLGAEERAEFLGKSDKERAEECAPVHTAADGTIFTKADDPRMVQMSKSADLKSQKDAEKLAKAEETILLKRADAELPHLPGTAAERAALLKATESIADEKLRTAALAALVAGDKALAKQFVPAGVGPQMTPEATDASAELDKLAKQHMVDNKVDFAKAYDAVLETPRGAELYGKIPTLRAN